MSTSLLKKILSTEPRFKSNSEAEKHYRSELERIAKSREKSVSELFEEIEQSPTWNFIKKGGT